MPEEEGMGNMMKVLRMRREVRMMESVQWHGGLLALGWGAILLRLGVGLRCGKEIEF